MENLFRPGKWLVLFCGVFILLWAVLQYVSNARLKEEAQLVGQRIFSWSWPGDNCQARTTITDTSVLRKTDRDAIVMVKGKQTVTYYEPGQDKFRLMQDKQPPGLHYIAMTGAARHEETADCAAKLTFYRMSQQNKDYWVLGNVEFLN